MTTPPILRQFTQYVLVGGLAFIVDISVLFLATEMAGLHYLISASIAFLAGLATNYLLCIVWVFDFRALNNKVHEFIIFGAIGILGLLLNNLLMYLLTEHMGLHYLVSKIVAAIAILLFNFSLRRTLLFRDNISQRTPTAPTSPT